MGQLELKDIYFGKTDAYNEFISFGNDACRDLFFEFQNIDIQKILDGEVYYFCGDKGTGKTMLLKYIETIVQEQEEPTFTSFIRFKKDIDDEQRNMIKRTGNTVATDDIVDNLQSVDSSVDCRIAWQVYLIKTIVYNLNETEYGVFDRNENWERLSSLIYSIYKNDDSGKKSKTIIPKVKRGNVEINISSIAKFEFDLEWTDDEKKTVSFKSIATKIIDLYCKLTPTENSIYVFVNELELSLKKNKQYERDIILIRDLIFAIQYLSEISKENGFSVYFLAAIRNEVYKSVLAIGMEINKPIHDFGLQISWRQNGGNIKDNPLLQMLKKRIEYSEQVKGISNSNDVWLNYFAQEINNKNVYNYIINQTWNKPRDIIRLFTIIQQQFGKEKFIDQKMFDAVKQQYSAEAWEELVEALSVKYTDYEIDGIRLVLSGISLPFTVSDFSSRIEKLSNIYDEVESLSNKKTGQILRDLYDIGIVGNYSGNPRFVFTGDRDIDLLSEITIHYPLIKFFRASLKAFERV